MDFVFGKDTIVDGHSDVDKATRFIEQIQEIHQAVQEQLERSQANTRLGMTSIGWSIVFKLETKSGYISVRTGCKVKVKS